MHQKTDKKENNKISLSLSLSMDTGQGHDDGGNQESSSSSFKVPGSPVRRMSGTNIGGGNRKVIMK